MGNLERQINSKYKELESLKKESEKFQSGNNTEQSITQIIWEQFILQISGGASSQFYKENHNLNLSLDKADHILNQENFVNGVMPSHNFNHASEYQKRYDEWQANFTDSSHQQFVKNYRQDFDANRLYGNDEIHMDHTIPVSELLRDSEMATYMSRDEIINFANDPSVNLKPLDAKFNIYKSGDSMPEALYRRDENGLRAADKYPINESELLERHRNAEKRKKEIVEENREQTLLEGQKSIKSELIRSIEITASAVFIALLAKLTRDVMHEVFVWSKKENRNKSELFVSLKEGFSNFLKDTKNNVLLSVDVGLTTILAQIFGQIVITIRKVLLGFQVGWRTFKEIKKYINNPKNKSKDEYTRIIEIEKIAIKGVVSIGGIALSEVFSRIIRLTCPPLAVPILPILGAPANLIGICLGGIVSGVIGVLCINKLDAKLLRKLKSENIQRQNNINREISELQEIQYIEVNNDLLKTQNKFINSINDSFVKANEEIKRINKSSVKRKKSKNNDVLDEIDQLFEEL